MNFRGLETGLKLILFILTAFLAADMASVLAKHKLQTFPSFVMPRMLKKQFIPPPPPVVPEETEAPAISEALPPIKLIGTITGAYPYAVILDPANNRQELYRLKEEAGSGWLIDDIGNNKVILKKGNRKETLEVRFIEGEPGKPEAAGASRPAGTGVRIDPREVEGTLSDLNKVMTQARVVPNMVGGKTSGYTIFNIVPGSIYTKIGLQNNDIVERVNGVEINSPDSLYQLFQQLKNEKRIALDFKRDGKRESVNIEIR